MQGVLIDVTRLLHRFMKKRLPTGVDRVSLAYIRHFGPRARAVLRYRGGKFVFRRAESEALFAWLLALGEPGSPLPTIYKGLIAGCLAQRVRGQFLFNTGHSGLESDCYVAMLERQHVRPVFMVHDLIPITHPQYCRAGEQERHANRIRNAVRCASGIVCNSQATLNALTQWCGASGLLLPASTVALLAPELPPGMRGPRPVEGPYFVFLSTIEPRKNHIMLLRLWQCMAAEMGPRVPQLVIIGQRGWDYEEVTSLLEHSAVLRPLVREVSSCGDAELVNYLQHAQALLFPSFAEGFGMPVAEALAHGVPVIASDLPVFREFAHGIPEYVNALDVARWGSLVADYAAESGTLRAAQLARLAGFVAPTWAAHFAQVDGLLDQLAQAHA